MKVCLCTLVLNEMEWLPRLVEQHLNWPGLVKWVFVEAADIVYARVNPDMVSPKGLSVDGTTEFLEELAAENPLVTHIKHGYSSTQDSTQHKCQARSRYLDEISKYMPDWFHVIDGDEFYPTEIQKSLNELVNFQTHTGICVRHREIWHPPYCQTTNMSQFSLEIMGGFWDIPYCRTWKWMPNLSYSVNHNTPDLHGKGLDAQMLRYDRVAPQSLYYVHMAFASSLKTRQAKHRYYEVRGEAIDPRRKKYCASRRVFESWRPGSRLPEGVTVTEYNGIIPEVFQ